MRVNKDQWILSWDKTCPQWLSYEMDEMTFDARKQQQKKIMFLKTSRPLLVPIQSPNSIWTGDFPGTKAAGKRIWSPNSVQRRR